MARRRSRRNKATVLDFDQIVSETLQDYGDDVADATELAISDVADDAVKMLKTIGDYEDITGDYRNSFTQETVRSPYNTTAVVFADTPEYRRTHLLEKPHLNRDGTTRSKAFPHWAPTEEMVNGEIVKVAEKRLGDMS